MNDRPAMLDELSRLVPPSRLVGDPIELMVYECDGLPVHRQPPSAVALPVTRDEVVALVKWCAARKIPFVARGAGTGLSGGCTPAPGAIVLDLNRMNRILEIDAENRFAVVEPGVINVDLTAAAAPLGLHYAPDPSSQTACTLGGNVAENSGGPHCLKYGVTSDHVLATEVVLPDGRVVELGDPRAERPGLDLNRLFVGSEGTLGIATKVTVKLVPIPAAVRTFLAIFDSMGEACRTVTEIVGSGIVPVALEILDRNTIGAIEASVNAAGYPAGAAAALLIELDGVEAGMDEEERAIGAIVERNRALEFRTARDPETRLKLWKGRKAAFGTMGRVNTDLYVLDGVVPRTRLEQILESVYEIAARHDVVVSNVFHAGDGNLHPNLSYDGRDPDEKARVLEAGREILEACVAVGGTISGEHGIGSEKSGFLPLVLGPDDLALQRALRDAFDPDGLSNPGKMFPKIEEAEGAGDGGAADRGPARVDAAGDGAPALPGPGEEIAPGTPEEAGAIVRAAEAAGTRVRPAGHGAHAPAAAAAAAGAVILSARGFADVAHYEPGDFTIGLGAGVPLSEARDLLARNGQEIPFDAPESAGGTIGGLVARAPWGPRSASSGGLAPWVLGVEGVRGEGRPFRAGGMVVKNVAGYQVWKLAVGARGRTGLLTRANFKLRPRPERRRLDLAGCESAEEAWSLARALRDSRLEVAMLGIHEGDARRPMRDLSPAGDDAADAPFVVAWCFEGSGPRVEWLGAEAAKVAAGRPARLAADLGSGAAGAALGRIAEWGESSAAERVAVLPSAAAAAAASRRGADLWTDVLGGVLTIRGGEPGAAEASSPAPSAAPPDLVAAVLRAFDPAGVFADDDEVRR